MGPYLSPGQWPDLLQEVTPWAGGNSQALGQLGESNRIIRKETEDDQSRFLGKAVVGLSTMLLTGVARRLRCGAAKLFIVVIMGGDIGIWNITATTAA